MADAESQEGGRSLRTRIGLGLGVVVLLTVWPWKPLGVVERRSSFEPCWQTAVGGTTSSLEGMYLDGPRLAVVLRQGFGGNLGVVLDRAGGQVLANVALNSEMGSVATSMSPWPGTILTNGHSGGSKLQLWDASDFSLLWSQSQDTWSRSWCDWGDQLVMAYHDFDQDTIAIRLFARKNGQGKVLLTVPSSSLPGVDLLGLGKHLLVSASGQPLRALDAAGRWSVVVKTPLSGVVMQRDGELGLVGVEAGVVAIEAAGLRVRWKAKVDRAACPPGQSGRRYYGRPLAAGHGAVVTADQVTGDVVAINLDDGQERWRQWLGAAPEKSWFRTVAGGFAVVTMEGKRGRLHWLDAATGATIDTLLLPGRKLDHNSPLLAAGDRLYFAHARRVYSWRLVSPGPPAMPR